MEQQTPTTEQRTRGGAWKIALALLLALELMAAVVLSTRLVSFADVRHNFIALLGGAANQRVMSGYDEVVPGQNTVRDDVQVWTTETPVELFKLRYDNNGDMVYTVESGNGDKVLAPGTENDYTFTVGNPGTELVAYSMNMEAWLEGMEETPIPLEFRMYDDTGRYYVGSETDWTGPEGLNHVDYQEALEGGQTRSFTIEWRWPFEYAADDDLDVADAYDTSLGNDIAFSTAGSFTQHVVIRTQAEVYQVGEAARAWWGGSSWALVNLIAMILTDLLALWEIVKFAKGDRKRERTAEEITYAAEGEEKKKDRQGWKLLEIVPLLFGTLVFLVTENIRLPMVWVDKWTVLMLVTLAVAVTLALLTRKKKDPEDGEA